MRQNPAISAIAIILMALATVALGSGPAAMAHDESGSSGVTWTQQHSDRQQPAPTYSAEEIIEKGHIFFGNTTKGFARTVEFVFDRLGRPHGYILGEEGAAAFVGGLRFGEGALYLKNGQQTKVYWQGPSVGFDFGGNGSRTLVLVYNIDTLQDIFSRFSGVEGSAYFVAGFGVNFQSNDKLRLAPIRTGVGARLGANVGYLKYTPFPTWNPF